MSTSRYVFKGEVAVTPGGDIGQLKGFKLFSIGNQNSFKRNA